jgi:nifR3 family TIM-barrel protein
MQIGGLNLNNRYFLAPLAGISNLPFRLLNKEFGCALVYTEMISTEGLIRHGKKTRDLLISDEKEKPVSYQIFGSDPERMAEAARICEQYGADIVDINMGCPVKKVIKNGAGSALMAEPQRVGEILKSIRQAITVPLTIKMRLGLTGGTDYLEISKIAEAEGVDAICLHPRTRGQHFKGDIDLDALRKLKESVSIPVIGSGNLFTVKDVSNMFIKTGCDAVVIARGALGNPFIFKDLIHILAADPYKPLPEWAGQVKPSKSDLREVILKHIDHYLEYYPEKVCHRELKKHMIWYTKGLSGSSDFRKRIVTTKDLREMITMVEEYLVSP